MIHVFHGFLGSPEDFSFLSGEEIIHHDLYEMSSLPKVSPEDTLIGYSMGGRIALEVADRVNFNIKKIVLINAHPGLGTDEERTLREAFENQVLTELTSRSEEDFINWWNNLAIFSADKPIAPPKERFHQSKELFDRNRLSRQKNFLPKLTEHLEKVLWIVGLSDKKYMELVSDLLLPHDITVKGIPGGHRLFQYPEELKKVLIEEGIL